MESKFLLRLNEVHHCIEYAKAVLKQKNDPLQSRSKYNRDKYNKQHPNKEQLA